MNFLSKAFNAVGAEIADSRAMAQYRREHDAWARTARIGETYWTVNPVHPGRKDLPWTRDEYGEYTFTKRLRDGSLAAYTQGWRVTSWSVWCHHGPLGTVRPPKTPRQPDFFVSGGLFDDPDDWTRTNC